MKVRCLECRAVAESAPQVQHADYCEFEHREYLTTEESPVRVECYCGTEVAIEGQCPMCKRVCTLNTQIDREAAQKALEQFGANLLEDLEKQRSAILDQFVPVMPYPSEPAWTYVDVERADRRREI